jgi:predicted dehydrogenase
VNSTRVGIIGQGKMGKIYIKEISENKKFTITEIITKKKIINNPRIINLFLKKKIDLIIIATPINTHYKYLKLAIMAKKNIIIEKPIVKNFNELNKLMILIKNYKKKIFIHHNDLLNLENIKFLKKKQNHKLITKILMKFGKFEKNSYKNPHIDWLPHPMSIIYSFFGDPEKFEISKYEKETKNNFFFEKLNLFFTYKKLKILVYFSNKFKKPFKKITFFKKADKLEYDGYLKKNQKTVKLLLKKYNEVKSNNDILKFFNTYKTIFKISKLLKNY